MSKDVSFRRFFNPDKSPRTQFNYEKGIYDYFPKHSKKRGRMVWNSYQKGTYVRAKHGELK